MEIKIKVEEVLVLDTFKEWVNRVPRALPNKTYYGETFLFVDKNGCYLHNGVDFKRADELGTFPITVYKFVRVSEFNDVKTKLNK